MHLHGTLTIRDDERFARGMVGRLTKRHESAEAKPWTMSDAPAEYIAELLTHIVGIEIDVTSMIGISKLSQNKDGRDRSSVIQHLAERGQAELAPPHAKRGMRPVMYNRHFSHSQRGSLTTRSMCWTRRLHRSHDPFPVTSAKKVGRTPRRVCSLMSITGRRWRRWRCS